MAERIKIKNEINKTTIRQAFRIVKCAALPLLQKVVMLSFAFNPSGNPQYNLMLFYSDSSQFYFVCTENVWYTLTLGTF